VESGESVIEDEKGRLPAHRVETSLDWTDLALPPEGRDAVDRIADLAPGPAGNVPASDPKGVSGAVLFQGPPGTGKTMVAALLGKTRGRPVWVVDLSAIAGKYIGETEKTLDRIVDAAEAAGAILLFDEADALFGKRTQVKDAHDRYANVEADHLLHRLERFRGLVIFATDRPGNIDPAFARRLRFVVDFPMPDAAARLILWRQALPRTALDASVDMEKLAFEHALSGGAIVNVARHAILRSAGAAISEEQLEQAIATVQARTIEASPGNSNGAAG
jgi:SpoVK/Ycf46/Vps4 family AAA+-type ATPase